MEAPGTTPTEYLFWAENSSNLSIVADDTWWLEDGKGTIPTGYLEVTNLTPIEFEQSVFYDGSDKVVVTDNGNRSLGFVSYLVVARGDVDVYDDDGWVDPENPSLGRLGSLPYQVFQIETFNQDSAAGIVQLTSAQLLLLGGGLSKDRGDVIITVRYTLAPARFWWSRNDRYETRFGYNGSTQRWEPFKGTAPKNLGRLGFDGVYTLTPRVSRLPLGAFLPGNQAAPDRYSMIRLGEVPDSLSTPVAGGGTFTGIQVREDDEIADFDFTSSPTLSGVMGQGSGVLRFNPSYVDLHAGKSVWYVYQDFQDDADGVLGDLGSDPLFLCPIPGPSERPILRYGSRRDLSVIVVSTEFQLAALTPSEGQVAMALSTGKLKLSAVDIAKADPSSSTFDKHYLGEQVVYAGVTLNQVPLPTKAPVRLTAAGGASAVVEARNVLYVPDAVSLPDDFVSSDPYRGLGRSGVLDAPDGTGAPPALPGTPASSRPGGEALSDPTTGRVRQVISGVGDTMVFSRKGLLKDIEVVQTTAMLPSERKVPEDTIYIAKEYTTGNGSQVALGAAARRKFLGDPLYFLQAELTPATYTTQAEVYSRNSILFRFDGTEALYFAIDGQPYVWLSSTLTVQDFYTPDEVAASINAVITGPTGAALEVSGRIALTGYTSVEIGWGTGGEKDLSGCAALGFLPGWRVVAGVDNWLPDSGVALGLQRSPANLDRSNAIPDAQATGRISDQVLVESVPGQPFVFLTQPPIQDIAGYDQDVFFTLTTLVELDETTLIVQRPLQHYEDIQHRFGEGKFAWLEPHQETGVVSQPLSTLALGRLNVVPETMLGAPSIGGGLYVASTGGKYELLEQGSEYLLPGDGQQGYALLSEQFGGRFTFGGLGVFSADGTLFTDSGADFSEVQPGYRLKVTSGPAEVLGSYLIQSVPSATSLEVSPPFLATPDHPVTWEIYTGYTTDVFDPSLIGDVVFQEFQHLPEEPFKARVLTSLGVTPTSAVSQEADRLNADLAGAVESGRPINLRFGLEEPTADNTAALYELGTSNLGTLANDVLIVPDTDFFSVAAFSIQIGSQKYEQGSDLLGVTAFSPNPGAGDGIQYLTADWVQPDTTVIPRGTLRFGFNILADFDSSQVYYVEEFRDPVDVPALVAEYNRHTGDINIGQTEIDTFGPLGTKVYFVEQMVTEGRQDVALSPMVGAFSFRTPLSPGQVIEVSYYEANVEGRKVGEEITEFLPVFVRDETALRQTGQVFRFNTSLKTIDRRFDPIVYVGPMQQNFGSQDYVLEFLADGSGQITFTGKVLKDYINVIVTYAVFEANGGERSYESSTKPVYRPPFFIKENISEFGLRGDRTGDFQVGQMLRIGNVCFYITHLTYYPLRYEPEDVLHQNPKGDVTGVGIFPPTLVEVGSRSPGNDVLSLITDRPIALEIDPDGDSPIPADGSPGFWQNIPLDLFPFEPVNRGQATMTFQGDLSRAAVAGHVLEAAGKPYTIAQVELNEDGTRTRFTLTSPFLDGLNVGRSPTIRISYRPVYPPDARDMLGSGPIIPSEPIELVLFGEENGQGQEKPGRTLIPGVDYSVNAASGAVRLLDPFQDPFRPGQSFYLTFTRQGILQPFMLNGVPITPRFYASFRFNTFPTEDNGYLGGRLTATYSFRNPDTFYTRIVPLRSFLGEAVEDALNTITNKTPAGGPIVVTTQGADNWEQGRVGLLSQRQGLEDLDRAARVFLDFYNQAVVAFEQVRETIDGGVIGDRDGKFRFFIGKGREYAPPGFEDEITGTLNPRNVFAFVFNAADPNRDIIFTTADNVVAPTTAEIVNGIIEGKFLDPDALDTLVESQYGGILNDVDDVVLTGLKKPVKVTTPGVAPYFRFEAGGIYDRLSNPSFFSRLFPRAAHAFLTTYPGIGSDGSNPGEYTAGKPRGGKTASTSHKVIGQLANPALGEITEVVNATMFRRRARARIWGYFDKGLPAGAFNLGTPTAPIDSPAINRPCLIATPALLRDVPVDPMTGYPDLTKFLSEGGEIPDLTAGDPDLAVPGFAPGDQLAWGKPDGQFFRALNSGLEITLPSGEDVWTGVFVDQVLYGCVLLFRDGDDPASAITSAGVIYAGTTFTGGYVADGFLEQGDTVYAEPVTNLANAPTSDPPTSAELLQAAQQSDNFRLGFDLEIRQDGSVIDLSLPSTADGLSWGLKEILAQNSPGPLSTLEGDVQFVYTSQNPFQFPALQGLARDDDGDFQLPYLKTANTELDRFGEASAGLALVMTSKGTSGGYVYPDEIVSDDGSIIGAVLGSDPPAALLSAQDFLPVTSGSPDLGIGDVRPFDLLLIEVNQAAGLPSIEGFLSVGLLDHNWIEPPRFVTETTPPTGASNQTGSPVQYGLDNAVTFIDPGGYPDPQTNPVAGVLVTEVVTAIVTTVFDFSSLGLPPELADGLGNAPATGGFNDIWSASSNNRITIELIRRPDPNSFNGPIVANGAVESTIVIQGNTVTATPGGSSTLAAVPNPIQFGSSTGGAGPYIQIQTVGQWFDLNALPGQEANWYLPYQTPIPSIKAMLYGLEFKISVDTTNTLVDPGQSTTAYISEDRLTFNEVIDLRHMQARGTTHPLNVTTSMETRLVVHRVTVGGGYLSYINESTNGAQKYTFLARPPLAGPPPPDDAGRGLGTWTDASLGVSPERGTMRVMGFEGYNNTPILTSALRFSAVPSSVEFTLGGDICSGTGKTESKENPNVPNAGWYDDRLTDTVVATGSLLNIEPGDVLAINKSSDVVHWATHKAGTYLIHHAVEDNTASGYQELAPSTTVGLPGGWSNMFFTQVVEFTPGPAPLDPSTLTVGSTYGYPATGRVYLIRSLEGIKSPDETIFKNSIVSAAYTGISGNTFTGVGGFAFADGVVGGLTNLDFAALATPGLLVSGRERFPVDFRPFVAGNLNSRNLVGWEGAGATKGLHRVTFWPPDGFVGASILPFTGGSVDTSLPPAVGRLGVELGVPGTNSVFVDDPNRILYPDVVVEWGFNLNSAQWKLLNIPASSWGFANPTDIECILPGTRIALEDIPGTTKGLHIQAGVFLEPSFPRQVFDLSSAGPHVVDADFSLVGPPPSLTAEIGMRNTADYQAAVSVVPEEVTFQVRRIRRFHDVNGVIGKEIQPLRFAYEIRRGRITDYTTTNRRFGVVSAKDFTMNWVGPPRAQDVWNDGGTYSGTNLGSFTDPDVNINPGDLFRVLDADGKVKEYATIASILDESTLLLEPPGLISSLPLAPDQRFEIFLRRAPVPHEQSNEQLLDLITDRLVHETFADEINELGGYVPADTGKTNQLFDDLNAPGGTGSDFADLGVRRGDIVIVDPMGTTPITGETGVFHLGDVGLSVRAFHDPGSPSVLDDNRGWYRVTSVVAENGDPPHLEVSGETIFTGPNGGDVTFPSDAFQAGLMGYAVYPTVSDSGLTGNTEGQMDLRPTDFASGGTFGSNYYSMRPFSYRIIRPSNLFSPEAVDLVLCHRERVLSMLQLYKGMLTGSRSGDYFILQRDRHLHDLGDPVDFLDGVGVLTNAFIESVIGEVDKSPYYNSSSALAFLDRRFWILDRRLDSLVPESNVGSRVYDPGVDNPFPLNFGPYTAFTDEAGVAPGAAVRPVLPDRIDVVLDAEDRFRPIRYTWLSYRTHRVLGTLPAIDRFDAEYESRVEEQQRLLDIQISSEGET